MPKYCVNCHEGLPPRNPRCPTCDFNNHIPLKTALLSSAIILAILLSIVIPVVVFIWGMIMLSHN